MTLFYSEKLNTLSSDESNHCLRTLRKKINEQLDKIYIEINCNQM